MWGLLFVLLNLQFLQTILCLLALPRLKSSKKSVLVQKLSQLSWSSRWSWHLDKNALARFKEPLFDKDAIEKNMHDPPISEVI